MAQETQDPILSMERFAIVVTDKNGNRFVRTSGNGHPSAMICTLSLGDRIIGEVAKFHSREIAECYRKDTIDLVRTVYMNTRITARPPFKAEVVPVSFKIG